MALIYAGEDFDFGVVVLLRQLGHDLVTVQEAGRRGGDDRQALADATSLGRAVLTFNRRHFRRLHRQSTSHAGIISCTRDNDLPALATRIDQAIAAAGPLAGLHIRVNLPASLRPHFHPALASPESGE